VSETKHSPEPWSVGGMSGCEDGCYAADGSLCAEGWPGDTTNLDPGKDVNAFLARQNANARRIVACVNACAGLPTEALEAGALAKALGALARIVRYASEDAAAADAEFALRALGKLP
jgi:hypothetical protein